MASVREEVESFHQFAKSRLAKGGPEPSLAQLYIEWQHFHEQESVDEAIRRGLDDIEAGRFRPADEVTESIRERFGFSK